MADKKISQLTALTTQASADELVIVDSSASETKKITVNNLFQGIPVNVGIGTGTSSPGATLDVDGTVDIAPSSGDAQLDISNSANTGRSLIYFSDPDGTGGRILFNHATNAMSFETNGTSEAMRIDNNQNLLVGTTATSVSGDGARLMADGQARFAKASDTVMLLNRNTTDGTIAEFRKDNSTVGDIGTRDGDIYIGTGDTRLRFSDGADDIRPATTDGAGRDNAIDLGNSSTRFRDLRLGGDVFCSTIRGHNDTDTRIQFLGSDVTRFLQGGSESARIDASGNLLVGTTSDGGIGHTLKPSGQLRMKGSGTTGFQIVQFSNDNGQVGNITTSGSATAFNTSSDQRLKDNIVDAPSASDDIDAIQVRSFDWKADGAHQKYGMVAQELQDVAPEAVSGDADSDDMMGVDYSKLVPMMLKEIQSLRARVAQLEGEN